MTDTLDRVISCQERLIQALDRRDVTALEAATAELQAAINVLSSRGAVHEADGSGLDHALRQSNAARIRVNVLADWTRQRIDRITEIRNPRTLTYGNARSF